MTATSRRNSSDMTSTYISHEGQKQPVVRQDTSSGSGSNLDYVQFLREKERLVCPDGFLDSQRYRSSYEFKQKSKRGPDDVKKKRMLSVIDVSSGNDHQQKDYEKQIKSIEELMWKHKHEARELRQQERFISWNQKLTQRSLCNLETDVSKNKVAEDKKLHDGLSRCTVLQQRHNAEMESMGKARSIHCRNEEEEFKRKDRNVQVMMSKLERKYKLKMTELGLKRDELRRLGWDYQRRMKLKEYDASVIKNELIQLAIELNVEAEKKEELKQASKAERKNHEDQQSKETHKRNEELQQKLCSSSSDLQAAENSKRKLDRERTQQTVRLQVKEKEDSRHKIEVQKRLQNNRTTLKELGNEAERTKASLLKQQLSNSTAEPYSERSKVFSIDEPKRGKDDHEQVENFQKRLIDLQRQQYEDHLKHIQKFVTKEEQQESEIFKKLKEADFSQKNQHHLLMQLEVKWNEMRHQNDRRIARERKDQSQKETELQQSLQKEQAFLAKVATRRNEFHLELKKLREQLRRDQFQLAELDREQERNVRVQERRGNDLYIS